MYITCWCPSYTKDVVYNQSWRPTKEVPRQSRRLVLSVCMSAHAQKIRSCFFLTFPPSHRSIYYVGVRVRVHAGLGVRVGVRVDAIMGGRVGRVWGGYD